MPDPQIVLYHGRRSRSVRVRWMLEEMGLGYRLERVDFTHGNVGGEAYKAVNPLQKVPALEVDGAVMLESLAMLEFLGRRFGPTDLVVEPDEPDFARYLEWLHYGEASLSMAVNLGLAHSALLPEDKRNPALFGWARSELSRHLDHIAVRGLADGCEWLAAGRFTAADMSLGYMLFLMKLMRLLDAAPSEIQAYWERLIEREAWKRASAD